MDTVQRLMFLTGRYYPGTINRHFQLVSLKSKRPFGRLPVTSCVDKIYATEEGGGCVEVTNIMIGSFAYFCHPENRPNMLAARSGHAKIAFPSGFFRFQSQALVHDGAGGGVL
jgi:hypothetical protein